MNCATSWWSRGILGCKPSPDLSLRVYVPIRIVQQRCTVITSPSLKLFLKMLSVFLHSGKTSSHFSWWTIWLMRQQFLLHRAPNLQTVCFGLYLPCCFLLLAWPGRYQRWPTISIGTKMMYRRLFHKGQLWLLLDPEIGNHHLHTRNWFIWICRRISILLQKCGRSYLLRLWHKLTFPLDRKKFLPLSLSSIPSNHTNIQTLKKLIVAITTSWADVVSPMVTELLFLIMTSSRPSRCVT